MPFEGIGGAVCLDCMVLFQRFENKFHKKFENIKLNVLPLHGWIFMNAT